MPWKVGKSPENAAWSGDIIIGNYTLKFHLKALFSPTPTFPPQKTPNNSQQTLHKEDPILQHSKSQSDLLKEKDPNSHEISAWKWKENRLRSRTFGKLSEKIENWDFSDRTEIDWALKNCN